MERFSFVGGRAALTESSVCSMMGLGAIGSDRIDVTVMTPRRKS
jgi:hypothetical protein